MGQGMLMGMVIAACLVIGFVVYVEEKGLQLDWDLHAKVLDEHAKKKESHAALTGMLKDIQGKHARGELPEHEPTKEELENARMHQMLQEHDDEFENHDPDAVGMFDALGNQMRDNKYDLQHRLDVFWRMDKNKDAFLTLADDLKFLHKVPSNLVENEFKTLDKNKDGAVGIREWCSGFHDVGHRAEPWYHHKYGYVYGHDIPNHLSKAKIGAVKKHTAEHKAALAGLHPAQTQKKIDDVKKAKEHKELNEKAHKQHEEEDEREHELHIKSGIKDEVHE